jgi:hypothetical protein
MTMLGLMLWNATAKSKYKWVPSLKKKARHEHRPYS